MNRFYILMLLLASSLHPLFAQKGKLFIIGGGEIYREAMTMRLIDRLYITLVHADVEGDTHFPVLDPGEWQEVSRTQHDADDRHAFAFSFVVLERV